MDIVDKLCEDMPEEGKIRILNERLAVIKEIEGINIHALNLNIDVTNFKEKLNDLTITTVTQLKKYEK